MQNRTIQIAKAGSIAEAAMELNHVFASAQKAADEYLNSVRAANEEAEQYAKADTERGRGGSFGDPCENRRGDRASQKAD